MKRISFKYLCSNVSIVIIKNFLSSLFKSIHQRSKHFLGSKKMKQLVFVMITIILSSFIAISYSKPTKLDESDDVDVILLDVIRLWNEDFNQGFKFFKLKNLNNIEKQVSEGTTYTIDVAIGETTCWRKSIIGHETFSAAVLKSCEFKKHGKVKNCVFKYLVHKSTNSYVLKHAECN